MIENSENVIYLFNVCDINNFLILNYGAKHNKAKVLPSFKHMYFSEAEFYFSSQASFEIHPLQGWDPKREPLAWLPEFPDAYIETDSLYLQSSM